MDIEAKQANLARMTGLHPLLFFKGPPGIFNDHRESGPLFNVSSEGLRDLIRRIERLRRQSNYLCSLLMHYNDFLIRI